MFSKWTSRSKRSAEKIKGRAVFLEPLTATEPLSLAGPLMTNESMESVLYRKLAVIPKENLGSF
jgi:hypothetical protein